MSLCVLSALVARGVDHRLFHGKKEKRDALCRHSIYWAQFGIRIIQLRLDFLESARFQASKDGERVATLDSATVTEIDEAVADLRQGDVVAVGWTGWFGTRAAPLTPEMSEAAQNNNDDDPILVSAAAEGLVVVTQTCDLVRSCVERPFVQLSPLVRLEEPTASQARRGMRPRYVHVPLAGEDAFADLDRVATVEKSLIARWERSPGLNGDREQRRFAQATGRKFSRFAFPDDLSHSLRGLIDRVKKKHAKASPEGRALETLEEIRVTGAPSWSSNSIEVFLTFAPATRAQAEGAMPEDEWDRLIDSWLSRCKPKGRIRTIEGAMIPLDDLTAREYVDSDPLDLDYLTP